MQGIILLNDIDLQLSSTVSAEAAPTRKLDRAMMGWNIAWMFLCNGITELIVCNNMTTPSPKQMFLKSAAKHTTIMRMGHEHDRIEIEHGGVHGTIRFVDILYENVLDAVGDLAIGAISDIVLAARGDSIADLNVEDFMSCHNRSGRIATVAAVRPPTRDGGLILADNRVAALGANAEWSDRWIDGGFYIVSRTLLAARQAGSGPPAPRSIAALADQGDLSAYRHHGCWYSLRS